MGDLNTFLKRIVALRQAIADDGKMHGVPFTDNDLRHLTERLSSEGSSFVKVTMPILGKALDAALIHGHFNSPMAFSVKRGTQIPKFCYAAFARVLDTDGSLRSSPCITTIFFLRQFLSLDGKLIAEPTPKQEEAAVNGFIDRQERLARVRLPVDHPVLQEAQRLLARMLKRCNLSQIQPGHGPGGVAEGYDRIERWHFASWPARAEKHYAYHEYGSQSFTALCLQGPPVMVKDSITKCSLVPKDYKGPRLISSESAATQYLQQGQMKGLMHYVENHWLMSRSIRFRDQTLNQMACRDAFGNDVATLDLSNASDTVSAALVWYLLKGVPLLRSQLFCTRSQYMKVHEKRVRITAFSPMGSAVCFPVETIVFWALTMASVKHVHRSWRMSTSRYAGSKDPMLPSESEMASAIAVFGDDILVPNYALAVLIGTLTEVGCEVNKSKTCSITPFRESCGAEYFNHIDVAIIRNRRYDYDDSKKLISNPVLLDLQRKFFLCGLYSTAALLREWAIEISPTITQVPRGIQFLRDLRRSEVLQQRVSTRRRPFDQRTRVSEDHEASHTAVPSGLTRFERESGTFEDICCAFGHAASLSCGVRTRYNANYQRMECRLPRVYQRTKEWPIQHTDQVPSSRLINRDRARNKLCRDAQVALETGYPRLLARVVGDSVERIAIRTLSVKMAWTELPYKLGFHLITG